RFDATTLDGGRFTASRLAGRPVALWFWAPWCPKCRREAPAVRKVAREFDGRIAFVGVAGKAETAQMKGFVRQYRLGDFPHVADANDPLWTRFEVPYQSSWVLLDQSGTVVHTGFLTEPELSTALEKLAA
ncbi:MAG TPA: redoxin domain-containing protein, partial [Actinopolymorphaceae bacterium]